MGILQNQSGYDSMRGKICLTRRFGFSNDDLPETHHSRCRKERRMGRFKEDTVMLMPGTRIVMTKGYKGVKGVIAEKTHSEFEFYIIDLENGIRVVAGPSAFAPADTKQV
jgi:hypothetical protein